MKLDYSAIWQSIKDNKGKLSIVLLTIVLIVGGYILYQTGETYFENRRIDKLKVNANQAIAEAANLKQEAANLEQKRIEANANVNAAVDQYSREIFGRDEAKQEVNKALGNYNKALSANSNVNATAEDVLKAIERLNQ